MLLMNILMKNLNMIILKIILINCILNDEIFSQYCEKFVKIPNYKLSQKDVIYINKKQNIEIINGSIAICRFICTTITIFSNKRRIFICNAWNR